MTPLNGYPKGTSAKYSVVEIERTRLYFKAIYIAILMPVRPIYNASVR